MTLNLPKPTTLFRYLGILLLATSLFLGINVSAERDADIITPAGPVPADRTEPITLFFPYGSASTDIDIANAVSRVTVSDPALQFVTSGFEDLYYGDPNRSDATNPPQQAVCNSGFAGPRYAINSSLATTSQLTYGLQSARNPGAPSGASTVDRLRFKHTGCIKVVLAVNSAVAQDGDVVDILFDEDFGNSPSYQCDTSPGGQCSRPARQIVRISIGAPLNPVSSSSSSSVSSSISQQSNPASSTPSTPTNPPVATSSSSPVFVPTGGTSASVSSNPTSSVTETPRSGGLGVAVILSTIAVALIGFIVYRVRKQSSLTKINVGNSSGKERKSKKK
jgi:hypothetical protein